MKRADIERLLPGNVRPAVIAGTPLAAVLDVMEQMHAPCEDALARLDRYFDCRRTPVRFVPYLARWVDLGPLLDRLLQGPGIGRDFPTGTGRLRELVALASFFSRWRGTRRGLVAFLETATGARGFQVIEQPGGRPFHLRIVAPAGTEASQALIEHIVELEKPAYTTYELVFAT